MAGPCARGAVPHGSGVAEKGTMSETERFGQLLRRQRKELKMSQRGLARKLRVEASHIAYIENGRRRPSLMLVAKIADVIGLDRQQAFVLAHPEALELINGTTPEPKTKPAPSWERFLQNPKLLERLDVTEPEMRALEQLSVLGTVTSTKSFVAILTLIRDNPGGF
jgi:transcriptional regulator with XRE-family HTH domain